RGPTKRAGDMNAMVIDWNTAMTTKRPKVMAKTCEQLSVDLSAYSDGELEGPEREALEVHLATCGACTKKLSDLKRLRGALSSLSAPVTRRGSVLDLLKAEMRNEGVGKPGKRPLS